MNLALLAVLAAGALAASPEEELGAAFRSLRDSLGSRPAARLVETAAPGVPPARPARVSRASAHNDAERSQCPADYQRLSQAPDGDLYSYLGFRWVRADESTCSDAPSERVLYLEPQTKRVQLAPVPDRQPEAETYALKAPEYKLRRNFYFRTGLDGARRFFAYDFRVDTGRQIPETVVLEFPNRSRFPLLPWEENETFELRWGSEAGASAAPVQASYEYRASRAIERDAEGSLLTRLRLEAVRKKELTAPDPKAVKLALGESDGLFTVAIEDRWALYYRGEKLGLRLKLMEDRFILPDRVAYAFDIELDAAERIRLQPQQARWNRQRQLELKKGATYYVDWSFRRADSRFTTGAWVEKDRTERFKF